MADYCLPCNIATALGLTKNICEEFKGQVDCRELQEIIDHPDTYTTDDAAKAITELAEKAKGGARELMDCVVTMMRKIPEVSRRMNFTVRIKNVPSGTAFWSVACYWNPPVTGNEAYSPVLSISESYTFTEFSSSL